MFELSFKPDRALNFRAGQYVSVVVPRTVSGSTESQLATDLRRAYSIASAPNSIEIQLCIQKVGSGPGSLYLSNLRPGDEFLCYAPYGFLTYSPQTERDLVFVATGTGLAPFRSILLSEEFQTKRPHRISVLLGVRRREEILYQKDLAPISDWVSCLTGEEEIGPGEFKGRVTDFLRTSESIAWENSEFYLCGNGAMIDEVRRLLKERGVDKKRIHLEIYFRPPKTNP